VLVVGVDLTRIINRKGEEGSNTPHPLSRGEEEEHTKDSIHLI